MSLTSKELQNHLEKLLSDESYIKIELEYICPSDLEKLLQQLDPNIEFDGDDIETNGWDVDFWISFEYKETSFCFSGSWYYGNYKIMKG